jgi:replication factor A1
MLCYSFSQLLVEIYHIPSSLNVVLSMEDQINENRKTIKDVLCMNPYEHKV